MARKRINIPGKADEVQARSRYRQALNQFEDDLDLLEPRNWRNLNANEKAEALRAVVYRSARVLLYLVKRMT